MPLCRLKVIDQAADQCREFGAQFGMYWWIPARAVYKHMQYMAQLLVNLNVVLGRFARDGERSRAHLNARQHVTRNGQIVRNLFNVYSDIVCVVWLLFVCVLLFDVSVCVVRHSPFTRPVGTPYGKSSAAAHNLQH